MKLYINKLAAWMVKNGFSTGHGEYFDELLQELEEQIKYNKCRWVDINQKYPQPLKFVLCKRSKYPQIVAYLDTILNNEYIFKEFGSDKNIFDITHWMDLPNE